MQQPLNFLSFLSKDFALHHITKASRSWDSKGGVGCLQNPLLPQMEAM